MPIVGAWTKTGIPWWHLACFSFLLAMVYGQAGAAGYAFSANAHDYSVSTYSVDDKTGVLRHRAHTPVPKMPSAVVLHPSGNFVYVVSKTPDTIAGFRLDSKSGDLSPLLGSPFPAKARSPYAMAFHPSGQFAYVAARFSGVAAYRINEQTGVLTPLPGSPFKAQQRTRSVVVHPSGQFVYAVNGYSNSISAYRINQQTGALEQLSGSPFLVSEVDNIDYKSLFMEDVPGTAGGIPYHIALDPEGKFAFVANWAEASISVFRIDKATGALHMVEESSFFSGYNPYYVSVHPSGKYVFVVQWSSNEIMVHSVDRETGKLTPVPGAPFPSGAEGPVAVVFNADGSRAYVPHYSSDDVVQFDVDTKTGKLAFVERVSTRLAPWSLALAVGSKKSVDQSGRILSAVGNAGLGLIGLGKDSAVENIPASGQGNVVAVAGNHKKQVVYAVDQTNNKLITYAVDPESDSLTQIPDGSVATGKLPADIAVDSNGWFVYVPNSSSNTMSVYYSDPRTGAAKPVRGSPVKTGKRPVSVTLDPAARFVFVANADSDTVSVFRNYFGTEALMRESKKYGSPFPTGKEPVALTVEPTGHFAYVANAGSNTISAYRVHHHTGALSELSGSPFKAGKRPVSIVVHPNGHWLYVANEKSKDVVVYRIEAELGALSQLSGTADSPVQSLPFKPKQLRLNTAGDVMYALSVDGRHLLNYSVNAVSGQLTFLAKKRLDKPVQDIFISE